MRHIGLCVEAGLTVAVLGAWLRIAASLADASILDSSACQGAACVKVPSEPCKSAQATGSKRVQSLCQPPR